MAARMGGPGMGMGVAGRRGRMTREELAEHELDWGMVRGIFRLAKPWWRSLVLFGVTSLGAALVGSLPALVFRAIIDNAIKHGDVPLLVRLSLLAIALVLGRSLLVIVQRWQSSKVGAGITYEMRSRIYDHVQRMPPSFFVATQTGSLLSRMNNDVTGAQTVLTDTVSTLTTNFSTFISTVAIMVTLDWKLTLVVLAAVPFFLIPTRLIARVLQRITRERFDLLASMTDFLHERLN